MTTEEFQQLVMKTTPSPAFDMTLIFLWVAIVGVIAFALGFAVGMSLRVQKMINELTTK